MDDFAASAKIPDFDKIISVIRSRDISVSIILQSMTQLEAMYNHAEATTMLNAYAAKIKRLTDGKIFRTAIVKRHDNNEIGEIVPLPITNANDAIIHLIRQNLKGRNMENYSAVHKIANLYMHRFFEYSDYVDKHPDIEDWEFKQTLLTAFCSEVGLHIGWLEKAMGFEEIPYDDIIV